MATSSFVLMIVFVIIGVAVAAGLLTFFLVRRMFQKQLKENPPISEKMIRVMFQQMGRKASESQIRQVMRSMQNAKD
ncbi:membrane protein [Mycoplasmopsis gallinacea]|uniref:Membrane protein n=1 Tax=Mycoplasmopsis gallinacea TaxID=29556 RepID=A0A0D5ZJX1_9BACT|nr:membrane protein [Mycoplasmopsis gallinacea]